MTHVKATTLVARIALGAANASAGIISADVPPGSTVRIDVGESVDVVMHDSLSAPQPGLVEVRLLFDGNVLSGFADIYESICPIFCVQVSGPGDFGELDFGQAEASGAPFADGALEYDFATVTFTGLAPGETDVVIDSFGTVDNPGVVLLHVIVPEPASRLLVAVGVGLCVCARSRARLE